MPNKIFRSSLTILSVEDEATKKLIYKNETPNTEFSPPICSFITDENDSQSMAGKLAREKNDANIKKNIFSVWWHYATSFEDVIQFNLKIDGLQTTFKIITWITRGQYFSHLRILILKDTSIFNCP